MEDKILRELFGRWLNGTVSLKEEADMLSAISKAANRAVAEELVDRAYDFLPVEFLMTPVQADEVFTAILDKKKADDNIVLVRKDLPPSKNFRVNFRRFASVAAMLVAIIAITYFISQKTR